MHTSQKVVSHNPVTTHILSQDSKVTLQIGAEKGNMENKNGASSNVETPTTAGTWEWELEIKNKVMEPFNKQKKISGTLKLNTSDLKRTMFSTEGKSTKKREIKEGE